MTENYGFKTETRKVGIAFYLDAKAGRLPIDSSRIGNVHDFLKDGKEDVLVIADCNGNYYQIVVRKDDDNED